MLARESARCFHGTMLSLITPLRKPQPSPPGLSPATDSSRLNWLRAGVLGANDGIVSVAAVVVGVAGATSDVRPILVSGLAALIGGALSMALGEYVSVSSQRDSLRARGGGPGSPDDANPWHAALASLLSFLCGGVLPFLTIVLVPRPWRIPITFVSVLVALAATGWAGARFGGAPPARAALRVVIGGALALAVTFAVGALLGTTVL